MSRRLEVAKNAEVADSSVSDSGSLTHRQIRWRAFVLMVIGQWQMVGALTAALLLITTGLSVATLSMALFATLATIFSRLARRMGWLHVSVHRREKKR